MTMLDEAFGPVNRLAANSRNLLDRQQPASLTSLGHQRTPRTRPRGGHDERTGTTGNSLPADCRLPTADCRLPTADARPPDDLPVDAEGISDSVATALAHEMATTTRAQIDSLTPVLVGHLNLLLREELGADENAAARAAFHDGYVLFDLPRRPGPETAGFDAFLYMRRAAEVTRRLLEFYVHRHGAVAG